MNSLDTAVIMSSPRILRSESSVALRLDRSISELMEDNVSNTPQHKVIYEDTLTGKRATYGGFREDVRKLAAGLQSSSKVVTGNTVSILSPSCVSQTL